MNAKVTLTGNIGQNVEFKPLENRGVYEISIATNKHYKDKDSKKQTITTWHRAKLFTSSEDLKFKKGDCLEISGDLMYDEYQDKNGSKIKSAYIEIDEFTFHP